MTGPSQKALPIGTVGAMATSLSIAPLTIYGSFAGSYAYASRAEQSRLMTPQDESLINARIDAKTAELRGDVRLNTQAVAEVKARLDDLSNRLASVPTDVAALKATVAELPRKGFIISATMGGIGLIAAISTFVQWVLSAHLLTK